MGLLDIKYYCDFKPLEKLDVLDSHDLEKVLYTQYGGDNQNVWLGLQETSKRIGKEKKYCNRVAIFLEILVPKNVKDKDVALFAKSFINRLLNECKLPLACWLEKRGDGRYIQFLISERKFFKDEITITEKYAVGYRYRNKVTGKLCKATDPNAELLSAPGDQKRSYASHYSHKKRMFAFKKSEFKQFLERVKRIIYEVCEGLNVKMVKQRFMKYIKHKSIQRFYSKYVNRNIRTYNDGIRYINTLIEQLEYAIFIAPTGFCNDKELVERFNALVHKTRQRLKKKSFTVNRLKISLSVFCRTDIFKENMELFIEEFENSYKELYATLAM